MKHAHSNNLRNQSNTPLERVKKRQGVALAKNADSTSSQGQKRSYTFSREDQRILRQLLEKPMDYIDNEAFYEENAERKIYEEAPDIRKPDASWYHPVMDDLGTPRGKIPKPSDQVILSGAEERVLFLQFNYARHCVRQIQKVIESTPSRQPSEEQALEMLRWYYKADQLREQLAETNLALVLAMAKRTRMSEVDFADLVSEGNMALLRAIDKFDCERGFKFSTYACRAILKAFSRQGMKLSKYRQRFPTDFDPKLEKSDFLDTKRAELVSDTASEVKRIVSTNTADLTDIEKTVIEHRFRIESGQLDERPMTLEQVGQIIGVTKERVRQIQNKALEKIRNELEAGFLAVAPREEEQALEDPDVGEYAYAGDDSHHQHF